MYYVFVEMYRSDLNMFLYKNEGRVPIVLKTHFNLTVCLIAASSQTVRLSHADSQGFGLISCLSTRTRNNNPLPQCNMKRFQGCARSLS